MIFLSAVNHFWRLSLTKTHSPCVANPSLHLALAILKSTLIHHWPLNEAGVTLPPTKVRQAAVILKYGEGDAAAEVSVHTFLLCRSISADATRKQRYLGRAAVNFWSHRVLTYEAIMRK